MANRRIEGALAIVAVELDRRLLREALQAAGAKVDYVDGKHLLQGNRPLAGIGDRVLSLLVTEKAWNSDFSVGMYIEMVKARLIPDEPMQAQRMTTSRALSATPAFIHLRLYWVDKIHQP